MGISFIKKAAPWIGTLVGAAVPGAAPFIGIASKLLSDGLGKSVAANGQSISDAITEAMANPDQLAKLKQIDDAFAQQMKQLDIQSAEEFEKIAEQDRESARNMQVQTRSKIPGVLAIAVTCGFFGLLGLAAFHEAPAGSQKVLDLMTGSLGTAWIMIVTYYFGSSAGSAHKTELLAQAPPVPK